MNIVNNTSKPKGKSVVFTHNILNVIYNHKGNNLLSEITLQGNKYYVGLCTEDEDTYVLKDEEILMIDMLLSWAMLTGNTTVGSICLSDIDFIRQRNKENKTRIKESHEKYINIFKRLETIHYVCADTNEIPIAEKYIHPLFKYELVVKDDYSKEIKYSFDELGKLLENQKQIVVIEDNIFNIRVSEMMKYKLLRYLIVSIFMNRIRKNGCIRTHKSVLSGITYCIDNKVRKSYYDYYCESEHISRYLNRYITRLDEVLMKLKLCNYIVDYSIERIGSLQELILGYGKITIITNRYKKKRKIGTFLSEKQ